MVPRVRRAVGEPSVSRRDDMVVSLGAWLIATDWRSWLDGAERVGKALCVELARQEMRHSYLVHNMVHFFLMAYLCTSLLSV